MALDARHPPESAKRPLEFVPENCGMRTTEAKVDTILKPMEERLNQRIHINRSRPDLQPDYGILASADLTGDIGAMTAALAGVQQLASAPSPAARAASLLNSMMPPSSPSIAGSMPPPAAMPSPQQMNPPPPPSATYIMPRPSSPSYSSLGPSASQAGSPAKNVLQLRDIKSERVPRGSLVHTVQYEGTGGWVQSPAGRVWVSAKHAGSKVIDLSRTCFAAFLPPDMEKGPFLSLIHI